MKRLFLDIETSLMELYSFQTGYGINVRHHQIKEESKIFCVSYKWEHQSKVKHLMWSIPDELKMKKEFTRLIKKHGYTPQMVKELANAYHKNICDKELITKIIELIDMADEVVAHCGDSFDIKKIRTRAYFHNIDMNYTIKSIDTYKEAKRLFKFESNGLEYISLFSGFNGKLKTDFDLWKGIHFSDKKSIRKMLNYCDEDVLVLENVFKKMNKYIKPKTHIGDYFCECPECGSDNIRQHDRKISASGVVTMVKKCMDCGKYHSVPEAKHYKSVEQRKKFKK